MGAYCLVSGKCSDYSRKECNDNYNSKNPNPKRFKILEQLEFKNSHILKVKYSDCTNFEGIKILVYYGKYRTRNTLDPHFFDNEDSPIARFKPTKLGYSLAIKFAQSL